METFIGSKQQQQQQEGVVEDRGVVRQCAVGYDNGMLRVFELTERKMIVKWQPHKRAIQNISYSNSGQCRISLVSHPLAHMCMQIGSTPFIQLLSLMNDWLTDKVLIIS